MKKIIPLFVLILCPFKTSHAEFSSPDDRRIVQVAYQPEEIYELQTEPGLTTTLAFGKNEQVEVVSIGDSQAWQVSVPEKQGYIFLKPIEAPLVTNMTVVTNQRLYSFTLRAGSPHGGIALSSVYRFSFTYSEEPAVSGMKEKTLPKNPLVDDNAHLNFSYSVSGSASLQPLKAFDDGAKTYLQFSPHVPLPAIFAVGAQGEERLLNPFMQGEYVVLNGIFQQLSLRDGPQASCIFNGAYAMSYADIGNKRALSHPRNTSPNVQGGPPLPPHKPVIEKSLYSRLAGYFTARRSP